MKIPGLKKGAQEKVNAALSRARKSGANFARGGVGSAYSAGTGAACFYLVKMATENDPSTGKPRVEFLQKQPYAVPVLLAVAGHMVKRKQHDVGAAMLGVAGFTAAQAYNAPKGATQTDATDPLKKALESTGVYGYGAGELVMPAGELVHPHALPMMVRNAPAYGYAEAGAVVDAPAASSFLALSDV